MSNKEIRRPVEETDEERYARIIAEADRLITSRIGKPTADGNFVTDTDGRLVPVETHR